MAEGSDTLGGGVYLGTHSRMKIPSVAKSGEVIAKIICSRKGLSVMNGGGRHAGNHEVRMGIYGGGVESSARARAPR